MISDYASEPNCVAPTKMTMRHNQLQNQFKVASFLSAALIVPHMALSADFAHNSSLLPILYSEDWST